MAHHYRILLVTLMACLVPGYAAAMVVDGGVISGLPPNTVVELDLGLGEPSTARTDASGEVTISDEEDDDFGTLYIPTGSDGTFELRDQGSGAMLGALTVDGARIAVASAGSAATALDRGRWFVDAGITYAQFDDLKTSVQNGAGMAEAEGFSVGYDADDDAWGGSLGVGYALGDGNPWGSKGSHHCRLRMSYTWYDDFKGSFTARAPGVTIDSGGKQEIEAFDISLGFRYYVADKFGLNAGLGYTWYDYDDSGSIVERETNTPLGSFSESNDDDTAKAIIGLSYDLNDAVGVYFEYQYDFDDTGVNGEETLINFKAGVAYSF